MGGARPGEPAPRYTVRYRATDGRGRTALIVEDARGVACLFCGGHLQACVAAGAGDAPAGLAARLAHRAEWVRVPPVTVDSLDGLCRLAGVACADGASTVPR